MSSFPPKTSCFSFVWFDFWVWFLTLERKKIPLHRLLREAKRKQEDWQVRMKEKCYFSAISTFHTRGTRYLYDGKVTQKDFMNIVKAVKQVNGRWPQNLSQKFGFNRKVSPQADISILSNILTVDLSIHMNWYFTCLYMARFSRTLFGSLIISYR